MAATASARNTRRAPSARAEITARIDYGTISGLLTAFALLVFAIWMGGSFAAFLNLPSLLIVVGGTLAVTLISYSFREILTAAMLVRNVLVDRLQPSHAAATTMLGLADQARRQGVLSLQHIHQKYRAFPFLHKALQMVIDGMPSAEVEKILTQELEAMRERHHNAVSVLHKAAETAPAMGLIGTLVGLVQMLVNLTDPEAIGPAMAIALLTTFYGAVMANMIFAPLAGKLENLSDREFLTNSLYMLGACSISRQENPRRLELQLNAQLPPAQRLAYFDE